MAARLTRLVFKIIPQYSAAHLALNLAKFGFRHPTRLLARINRHNLFLRHEFERLQITCSICGANGRAWYDLPDLQFCREALISPLRESLKCRSCGSTNRQRSVAEVFLSLPRVTKQTGQSATIRELANASFDARVLDTDEFSCQSQYLAHVPNYLRSTYLPDRPFGTEIRSGVLNLNLEALSLPSNSIDVLITSDVLEHVRDYERALCEIHRCLRFGGVHILTVPFDENSTRTRTLVHTTGGPDIFLAPPQYHGDHVAGRVLAYRIFGRDLLSKLDSIGFDCETRHFSIPEKGIFDATVFVAMKRQPLVQS